jgi:hypothetical protein
MASAAEEDNARRPRAAFFSPARFVGERGVALARLHQPQDVRRLRLDLEPWRKTRAVRVLDEQLALAG